MTTRPPINNNKKGIKKLIAQQTWTSGSVSQVSERGLDLVHQTSVTGFVIHRRLQHGGQADVLVLLGAVGHVAPPLAAQPVSRLAATPVDGGQDGGGCRPLRGVLEHGVVVETVHVESHVQRRGLGTAESP